MRSLLITFVFSILAAGTAHAQSFDTPCVGIDCYRPWYPAPSIDSKIGMIERALAERGRAHPMFGPEAADMGSRDAIAMTLRFWRPLTASELAAARTFGVEWFTRPDGEVVAVGAVYGARVPFRVLDRLAELPLRRAEAAWNPVSPRPLDITAREVGAAQAHALPNDGLDGEGRLIVDIDSTVDVLHPHFFRADGGRHGWVDVDRNGAFDPGVDSVDLDGDGEVDSRERLFVLDGATVDARDDGAVSGDDGTLQPRRDWLYADLNGDRERNVGVAAGFTEEDAAYGEPIFVVDDVDRDGRLEPGEPLYQLARSKFASVTTSTQTYVRGENLIAAATDPSFGDSFHGTGVSSILVGGQLGFHDRVGMAPGAEVALFSARGDASATLDDLPQLRAVAAAVELGADLVLHEWTNPYNAQHDGSTNLNAAMDAARGDGVLQITPVGNMNLSRKHKVASLETGVASALEFVVPAGGWPGRDGAVRPYSVVYLSLFWRQEQTPRVTLTAPDGASVEIVANGGEQVVSSAAQDAVLASLERSDRGTSQLFLSIFDEVEDSSLLAGRWTVTLEDVTADDVLWGRVADFYSGWRVGVAWAEPTTDDGTAVYPATADSAFGTAAYAGRVAGDDPVGALRSYSGRGPRIDGERVVDIAAPDDPIAALSGLPVLLEVGYGRSWFTSFGGTSGAGPHVAGAVVLLREQDPELSADAVERQIAEAARTASLDPAPGALPDDAWGSGKLDIFAALFGGSAPPNGAPVAALVQSEGMLDASGSSDPDGDPLMYRFDAGNDGTYERDWADSSTFMTTLAAGEFARVDVRDTSGAVAGALIEVGGDGETPDAGSGDASGGGPASGRLTGSGCSHAAGGDDPAPSIPLLLVVAATVLVGRLRPRRCSRR